ncbi:unnamed protein product [Lymnaea stagnalis]|uniref:Bicarbonate transporter-like transmembrane domain-containing protein n=1 Tax=Lymnaea stagnalis TaxID=6523 RepID=A0AAV2HC38_LYMST
MDSVQDENGHLFGNGDDEVVELTGLDTNGNCANNNGVFTLTQGVPDTGQDEDDASLLYCRYERLDVKDFHCEVRGSRDVEQALNYSVVLLDHNANNLSQVVGSMLENLVQGNPDSELNAEAAKMDIFTNTSDSIARRTIQGTVSSDQMRGLDYDQAWVCVMGELATLHHRHVAFARLSNPVNLGVTCQEARFVILVVGPSKEKATKSTMETGRTFSSLFTDMSFRHSLLSETTKDGFRTKLRDRARQMAKEQGNPDFRKSSKLLTYSVFDEDKNKPKPRCPIGQGMLGDLRRRLPHYLSDFKDGIFGPKTLQKVPAATFFVYFACVLPNLAFGMLNSNNTNGAIGIKKILFSQMFGGVLFALFGGQPLIIFLTTSPLALFTKIIYNISQEYDLDFQALFTCVGLWNSGFLILYSLCGLSKFMKWSSRSTEDIFSLFISCAFSIDAIRDCLADFSTNYHAKACYSGSNTTNPLNASVSSGLFTTAHSYLVLNETGNGTDGTSAPPGQLDNPCMRESSLLFLLLMLTTVWLGLTLFNFTKTPYLTSGKREILADYALPLAVLIVSFFGSFVFKDVQMKPFKYDPDETMFEVSNVTSLPVAAVFAAGGLGFFLSLLFFMAQNIVSSLVNRDSNKLKKGAAYHWDMFVVAIINAILSIFAFPWVHAALPHSPLHVRALADVEERVEQGDVQQVIIHVRETRLSGIISHVLIGLSMFMLPVPLTFVPRAVLDGLFLYVAFKALYGNQLFERVLLFFTEQAAYPPNHYIRRVPQRKIHLFTGIQIVQLLVLCAFGFSPIPYMKMVFPVLLMFLIPIRHKLVPKLIEPKYLKALDGR